MAGPEGDDGLRLQAHHAPGRRGVMPGIRQKLASTPTPGALSTIRRSMRRIGSSMADMIPGCAPDTLALRREWLLGYPEKALASVADALALGERIAHPFTLSIALNFASVVHLNRREPERARLQLEAAEALVAEQRLAFVVEPGMLRGVALVGQGAVDEAIARIREGVTKWNSARTHYLFALWFSVPGRGFGAARRSGDGTGRAARGIGNSGRHRRAYVGCGTAPRDRYGAARRK